MSSSDVSNIQSSICCFMTWISVFFSISSCSLCKCLVGHIFCNLVIALLEVVVTEVPLLVVVVEMASCLEFCTLHDSQCLSSRDFVKQSCLHDGQVNQDIAFNVGLGSIVRRLLW